MFDELEDGGYPPNEKKDNRSNEQRYGDGNRSSNSGGGGYQNNQGGQSGGYQRQQFQKKEDVVTDPYLPVAMYADKDFSEEAKNKLYEIAGKLINRKYTVRIYGLDKDFANRIAALSSTFVEVYLPWKNFNEIESKHYFNTLTCKDIARQMFSGWDKVPDSVKGILSGQVRMMFGDKNNSVALCLITWTNDGASKASELSKETGRASFIIKTASNYGFPVVNMSKQSSGGTLERAYGI